MIDLKTGTLVLLLIFSLILIGLGHGTKASGGLFWSRPFNDYFQDQEDPRFIKERQVGTAASDAMIRYITPVAVVLFVLLILTLLKII